MEIEKYTSDKAEKILSWIKDERVFYFWSAGKFGTYPTSAKTVNAFYFDNAISAYCFYEDNELIGHLTMRYPENNRNEIRFGFIIVDSDKRGKGYGKTMLTAATSYVFSNFPECEKISLGVFAENTVARRCYLAAGFIENGITESYCVDGKTLDCIMMEFKK